MAYFRKSVLRVGTYHSPDGVVRVTPGRLRHWESEHKRMVRANQVVPIDWDHADKPEHATPLSRDVFERRRRSARNTVGELKSIKVADDGKSATVVLKIDDPSAEQKAKANTVFVSPVIFDEWRDGRNRVYRDVITHVDIVNHPVDDSQGPFEACQPGFVACGLRMGLSSVATYRMGAAMAKMKPDDDDLDLDGDDDSLAGLDDDSDGDLGGDSLDLDGDGDADTDLDGDGMDDSIGDDDVTMMGDDDLLDADGLAGEVEEPGLTEQVIANLQAAGIAPPEGVDAESDPAGFLLQLSAALRQKKLSEDGADAPGEGDDDGLGDDMGGDTSMGSDQTGGDGVNVVSPEYAAMSLRLSAMQQVADRQNRGKLNARIDRLVKTGRLLPKSAEKLRSNLNNVRLSLSGNGKLKKSRLEERIELHESLPRGAYWPAERRMGLQGAVVVEPDVTGEITKAQAKKIVDAQAARMPGMYRQQ